MQVRLHLLAPAQAITSRARMAVTAEVHIPRNRPLRPASIRLAASRIRGVEPNEHPAEQARALLIAQS